MKFGLNSLCWKSPFSSESLNLLQKAKDMNFDIFEIDVEDDLLIDCKAIRKAAEEAGIGITIAGAFGSSRDMSADNEAVRLNAVSYVKHLIDFAVELGSPYVAGNMYAAAGDCRRRSNEEKAARFERAVRSIQECADYAAAHGIKLCIEPLNRFETDMINTVSQAIELLNVVGKDNVGLLLDTFHMNIEEENMYDAIRAAKGHLIDFHACANNRGTPGKDNLNWSEIRKALRDINYDGILVIESFTPDCVEIAKAASMWRPWASSPEALASDGVKFLRNTFE